MLAGAARWFGILLMGIGAMCVLGGLFGDTPMLISGLLIGGFGVGMYLYGRGAGGGGFVGRSGGDPVYAAQRERDEALYAVQRNGAQLIARLRQQETEKARQAVARAQQRTRELEGAWL